MDVTKIENSCSLRKGFCDTCNSHFMKLRPSIKEVTISKHFRRDLKDEQKINLIVKNVLDCSHMEFHELHKFEKNIDDNFVFRARKGNMHILYCITKDRKIIFLRAIRNYDEYKKLLEDKNMLKKIIEV